MPQRSRSILLVMMFSLLGGMLSVFNKFVPGILFFGILTFVCCILYAIDFFKRNVH